MIIITHGNFPHATSIPSSQESNPKPQSHLKYCRQSSKPALKILPGICPHILLGRFPAGQIREGILVKCQKVLCEQIIIDREAREIM